MQIFYEVNKAAVVGLLFLIINLNIILIIKYKPIIKTKMTNELLVKLVLFIFLKCSGNKR